MCACKCFVAPYNCILLISYVAFTMHTFMPAVLGAFIHEPGTHLIEYVFQYNWIVYPINSNDTTIRQWMVHCLFSWAIICLSAAGSIFCQPLMSHSKINALYICNVRPLKWIVTVSFIEALIKWKPFHRRNFQINYWNEMFEILI